MMGGCRGSLFFSSFFAACSVSLLYLFLFSLGVVSRVFFCSLLLVLFLFSTCFCFHGSSFPCSSPLLLCARLFSFLCFYFVVVLLLFLIVITIIIIIFMVIIIIIISFFLYLLLLFPSLLLFLSILFSSSFLFIFLLFRLFLLFLLPLLLRSLTVGDSEQVALVLSC